MTTTTTATERDLRYFQRERELLAEIAEGFDECEALAAGVCDRLTDLDFINDAFAFDVEGYDDGRPNRFRGWPRPSLQIECSDVIRELIGATRQLRLCAHSLEQVARRTSRSGRMERIARGFLAMADEAWRVAESYSRGRDQLLPDWGRINAIHAGVQRLDRLQDEEFRAEIAHDLYSYEQYRRDMIALGMGDYIRERVDGDPALQRVLGTLRNYVSEPDHSAK